MTGQGSDGKTRVTLTVSQAYDLASVIAEAERCGFRLERRLPVLHLLVGSIDTANLNLLSQIQGVSAAEEDGRVYAISEPDGPSEMELARRPTPTRPNPPGRPGQGRPGQGRPGQGRPGQGRPGQGRPGRSSKPFKGGW